MFSPVLWNNWQQTIVGQPVYTDAPKVLVLDDLPFYGGVSTDDGPESRMLFCVLVAIEYYQAAPATLTYQHRTRLVRAYPNRRTDAYELFAIENGILPDVLVSDSAPAILSLVTRLQKYNPDLVWVPSSFHLARQLRNALATMKWANRTRQFAPGDLADRLDDYRFLQSVAAWQQWWHDLEVRAAAQGVPGGLLPGNWRRKYYRKVEDALAYLEVHPQVPRGTGQVEANIRNQVKPFFAARAEAFTNIERINRAADLLTLRMNGQLDNLSQVEALLRADAESADGYVAPARQVTEPAGARLLRDDRVVTESLPAARRQARQRWLGKPR
jgi:hypothetical protein